ncbi:hypothetical protein [Paenibacillus luteus]|uniref:hypothetical protein n=1 Tax=Paenibacillus luteus TaxID=2545753 RepID=UPI001144084E|nr:hypothetical protein [Paenibacillus luteus]
MINAKILFGTVWIALALLLGACSQHENNNVAKDNINNAKSTVVENANPEKIAFHEGVTIDITQYENEEQYHSLLQTLQQNLKAIVQKDKAEFEEGFLSQAAVEANIFWIENSNRYQFLGKPIITEQNAYRIDISVEYRTSDDGKIKTTIYNFGKNDDGDWKITLID